MAAQVHKTRLVLLDIGFYERFDLSVFLFSVVDLLQLARLQVCLVVAVKFFSHGPQHSDNV